MKAEMSPSAVCRAFQQQLGYLSSFYVCVFFFLVLSMKMTLNGGWDVVKERISTRNHGHIYRLISLKWEVRRSRTYILWGLPEVLASLFMGGTRGLLQTFCMRLKLGIGRSQCTTVHVYVSLRMADILGGNETPAHHPPPILHPARALMAGDLNTELQLPASLMGDQRWRTMMRRRRMKKKQNK